MSYIMLHIPLRAGTKIPQAMDVSSQANRGAYHPGEILSMTTTICPRGTRDRASWDSPRYADCHRTQSQRPVGQNYDEMVDNYYCVRNSGLVYQLASVVYTYIYM